MGNMQCLEASRNEVGNQWSRWFQMKGFMHYYSDCLLSRIDDILLQFTDHQMQFTDNLQYQQWTPSRERIFPLYAQFYNKWSMFSFQHWLLESFSFMNTYRWTSSPCCIYHPNRHEVTEHWKKRELWSCRKSWKCEDKWGGGDYINKH